MQSLIVEAPLNSLSFGNVSLNILRELFNRRDSISLSLFPVGNKIDLSSYDSLKKEVSDWIHASYDNRFTNLSPDSKTIKLWHLNGSEMRIGTGNQVLYTFYEASEPTEEEKSLCSLQDKVAFSSTHSRDIFSNNGVPNSHYIPPGFDPDFSDTNRVYLPDKTHFGLMGKWEQRKHTAKILSSWAKRYGNNFKYQLTCCINNPFLKPKDLNEFISRVLKGKRYGNINFLPYLKTNSEVNDLLNSIDIDLTGLSGAEGWNLPSFNASALGKWSIVLNHTGHKDWATENNSILVDPEGTSSIEDGMFFTKKNPFNKGIKYEISEDKIIEKMEFSESFANNINTEGLKLKEKFSYKNTLDGLLNLL